MTGAGAAPAASCPRCDAALAEGRFNDVPLRVCPGCQGALAEQRRFLPLLESMARQMVLAIDPDAPLEIVADRGPVAACPACGASMESFDYLGSRAVVLDRCTACRALWLDPLELGAASLLYARTEARLRERRQALDGVRRFADRVIYAQAVAEAAARILTLGFATGGIPIPLP